MLLSLNDVILPKYLTTKDLRESYRSDGAKSPAYSICDV